VNVFISNARRVLDVTYRDDIGEKPNVTLVEA